MRLLLVKCRSDKSWLVIGVAEAFSLLVADQGGRVDGSRFGGPG